MREKIEKGENLSFKFLLKVFCAMFIGLLLLIPMIYIKNQIYYLSRDISVLFGEFSVLNEENLDLKKEIELINFKNQVLDSLEVNVDDKYK